MIQRQPISFSDEKFNLDYLTFNLPNSIERISEIAEIFYRYGFNSKIYDVETEKTTIILEDKSFGHTLTFRLENNPWNKRTLFIHFAGYNSRRIYFLIKDGYFSISQLNCQNLKVGRVDIQFIRPNQSNDTDVSEFLENRLRGRKSNFKTLREDIPILEPLDEISYLPIPILLFIWGKAIKRAISVGVTAYLLKYGLINETTDLFIHSSQEIQSTNNQKTYTVADDDDQSLIESKSVNSTRVKTGSGAVIEIQNQSNQTSEALKSALETRCGDLGKSGPGARAKADARRNFNKGSGSSIIPGASGYTPPHIYRIYKESGRLPAPQPKIEAGVPNFNDGVPPRIAPSVSPNRQGRIKSQPLRIKSEHQKTDVIVTKKDVKKWITPEQRKETSNQKINEQRVEEKFVDTVKKPNEVLDGIHIHREQKNCKVYIKDIEASDGTQKKLALIADTETGRSYLGSTLTEQEYSNLKKTGEIDLSDLRRDPQTLVMNQKSIQEAEALSRAKDEGCLTEFTDIRRPYNVSESLADFVSKDSMGSKINIDIKAIDGSGRRPLDRQTQDINQNIKDLFDGADDPTKLQIICDISALPSFLKDAVIKNITQGLASNQLDNISFLLD